MDNRISTVLVIAFSGLFLTGCMTSNNGDVSQYKDKSVNSVKIPNDLTNPNRQGSFDIKDYANNLSENLVDFSKDGKQIQARGLRDANTQVKGEIKVVRSQGSLVLQVQSSPEVVWNSSIIFLEKQGLRIKQQTRTPEMLIMETEYASNGGSNAGIGLIEKSIKKIFTNQIKNQDQVDKYKIVIYPTTNKGESELHLYLSSMKEVIMAEKTSEEQMIWQSMQKDIGLEDQMVYKLMQYLGEDSITAKYKIENSIEEKVNLESGIIKELKPKTKFIIKKNIDEAWDSLLWAIDQSGLSVSDYERSVNKVILENNNESAKTLWGSIPWLGSGNNNSYSIELKKIKLNETMLEIKGNIAGLNLASKLQEKIKNSFD